MKIQAPKIDRIICGLTLVFGFLFFNNFNQALGRSTSIRNGIYDNAEGSPVVDLINLARNQLDIEIYEMDDPKVIEAIRSAVARGVVVHIIKEPTPVGNSCRVFEDDVNSSNKNKEIEKSNGASCEVQKQLVSEVNERRGRYVPFTKPELCGEDGSKGCLQHGKIAVVDAHFALISSGNFNTTNLCDLDYNPMTCNRDFSYLTNDQDIVKSLQNIVERDMMGQKYDVDSEISPGGLDKLTVGPNSLTPIISFIRSAKKRIQLENQYLKDPTMNSELIAAAKRGVKVEIVLASSCSFGRPKAAEARRLTEIFEDFDRAGISTRMFNKNVLVNGRNGYLHAKAIVIDGKKAWMGSVNGSTQAVTLNREFGVFFGGSNDVTKLEAILESDFSNSNVESWQQSLACAENKD